MNSMSTSNSSIASDISLYSPTIAFKEFKFLIVLELSFLSFQNPSFKVSSSKSFISLSLPFKSKMPPDSG